MSTLPTAWLDGALVPLASATVSALDHGLVAGDGVFEALKVVRGVPFALRRHLWRLSASARGIGLPDPDPAVVAGAMAAVVDANDMGNMTGAVLRVTYTSGPGPLGSGREPGASPTLFVAAAPARPWEPTSAVHVVPYVRNERGALAGLKTTSYAENVVALAAALSLGADEAIFANTIGALCEGTGTNVFVGVAGRLLTPPLASGCLAGVTRALLLELGVAEEADLRLAALAGADEAFLASSTRDVHPVATVDGRRLGSCPGPLTAAASTAFSALVGRDLDP